MNDTHPSRAHVFWGPIHILFIGWFQKNQNVVWISSHPPHGYTHLIHLMRKSWSLYQLAPSHRGPGTGVLIGCAMIEGGCDAAVIPRAEEEAQQRYWIMYLGWHSLGSNSRRNTNRTPANKPPQHGLVCPTPRLTCLCDVHSSGLGHPLNPPK